MEISNDWISEQYQKIIHMIVSYEQFHGVRVTVGTSANDIRFAYIVGIYFCVTTHNSVDTVVSFTTYYCS